MDKSKLYWLISGTILVSVVLISFSTIFKSSASYLFKNNKDDITVTGSASVDFTSNLIVWRGDFSKKNKNLKIAFSEIKNDKELIKKFLLSKGVSEDELVFKSVDITKKFQLINRYNNDGDKVSSENIFDEYLLQQTVEITSQNVDLIESVANDITDLIEKDVFISSNDPRYFYTKLDELKIEMIKLASENGLLRAQTALGGGGAELGDLLETSIGVFQILGTNSNDNFSWGGTLNTSKKQKTAFVNVKQRFEID
ncbi:MAG: hypothetical protein CBC71_01630 [Rhodobacteraceae bacterium TMED111]|nr:MAG: hypothetical protein CBC71_01630 [Rhodobacteraceae bacterium TMED111]|tara:strand:- start:1368 stop:2132 length:765 start_codon:yes stop_codon:yes gene_type:complete